MNFGCDARRRSREPAYYCCTTHRLLQTPARSLTERRRTKTLHYVRRRSRECEHCAECTRLRERVGGLCPRRDPRRWPSATECGRASTARPISRVTDAAAIFQMRVVVNCHLRRNCTDRLCQKLMHFEIRQFGIGAKHF